MNQAQFTRTLAILTRRYPIRSQENAGDPIFAAKLFDIAGGGTWYVTEYDPETRMAFGYVTGLASDEWGYIPVDELMTLRWHGIPRIEIDQYFDPRPASTITGR